MGDFMDSVQFYTRAGLDPEYATRMVEFLKIVSGLVGFPSSSRLYTETSLVPVPPPATGKRYYVGVDPPAKKPTGPNVPADPAAPSSSTAIDPTIMVPTTSSPVKPYDIPTTPMKTLMKTPPSTPVTILDSPVTLPCIQPGVPSPYVIRQDAPKRGYFDGDRLDINDVDPAICNWVVADFARGNIACSLNQVNTYAPTIATIGEILRAHADVTQSFAKLVASNMTKSLTASGGRRHNTYKVLYAAQDASEILFRFKMLDHDEMGRLYFNHSLINTSPTNVVADVFAERRAARGDRLRRAMINPTFL